MKWEDKVEAAGLIDDLGDKGTTFDPAKARRLIGLVPLSDIFGISAQDDRQDNSFTGCAEGFGNIRIQDEPEDTRLKGLHFIGGYKVMHQPGVLTIFNDLSSPASTVSGGAYAVLYGLRSKTPSCMRLFHVVPRTFLGVKIGTRGLWEDWKFPAKP